MSAPIGSPVPEWAQQHGSRVRFDWGPHGLRALGPVADVVVVVDVLRFTTCVEVAVARGAQVFPYRWHDGTETAFAEQVGADLAVRVPAEGADVSTTWWLSPASLASIPAGTRLVLPSPNGSALSESAAADHGAVVIAGCLRNASAVAEVAAGFGGVVAVIGAGERWRGATGPLRPAVEDLLGAGAVIAALVDLLGGSLDEPSHELASPEAMAAAAAWRDVDDPFETVSRCASGREALARGWAEDVVLAADHDVSTTVPVLRDGSFGAAVDGVGDSRP